MKKGFYLLTVVFTLFGVNIGLAQKFNIKTYSVNEGLPSSNVHDVHKDKNGFLWFATSYGLVKYDGKTFRTFDNNDGLKDALIFDFHFEEDGDTWVSTELGGIAKLEGERFVYIPELAVFDTMLVNYITSIRKDELWIATNEFGVAIWDQNEDSIEFLTEENGLLSNQVWDVHFVSDSEIWVTTMYGIVVYDREGGIAETITYEDGLSGELMYEIAEDDIGRKWLATSNGVSIIQPDGGIDTITEIDGEELGYVFSVQTDPDGTVWIGTERRGLVLLEPDGTTTRIKRKNGLSSNFIYRIVRDEDGTMWVATDGNGISLFKDKSFLRYDIETELGANRVFSLKETRDGSIWIGTENGLSRLKEGDFTNYSIPEEFFEEDEIWDIEELPNGDLLMLTYTYELFQFDGEEFFYPSYYDDLYELYVADIFVDEDGSIWFSAFQRLTHVKNGEITHYYPPDDEYWQTTLGYIYRDSRGILWITSEGGIARFKDGNFEYYTKENGIPGQSVYEITEDVEGNLWVGTNAGIAYALADDIDKGNIVFNSFYQDELYINETVFLLFDQRNALWQGTNAGLNYFDLNEEGFVSSRQLHFPLSNNYSAVELNGAARIVDKNGTIWFGSEGNGLISFQYSDSESATDSYNAPDIFLREILADQEKAYSQFSDVQDPYELIIENDMNDVTFVFNAVEYRAPTNLQIRYRLEGYDESWNLGSDITEVRYTNLPAGDYVLQIAAKSIKSDWSETLELASISVLRPFYLTIPFFAGLVVFFGLISYLYINFRVSKIEKKELQKLVDKQTEDLSTALSEKEVLIKEIHHRVKNNLAVVSGLLELQGFRMPAGSAKMAIQESKMRVIAMSKIHENLYQNHDLANVDFRRFINELVKSIQATMNTIDKNIEVVQYIDDAFLDVNIGVPLGLVTNELVSNCYKHAFSGKKEGCISISFEEKDETYVLKVEDDGVGTSKNILSQKQKSLGITLIKSLSAQINAYLEYTNQVGSCFTLTVPKKQPI